MEQTQSNRLEFMGKIGKRINKNLDINVFKTMIMLSVAEDGREKLTELEKTHSVERDLLKEMMNATVAEVNKVDFT